MKIVSKYRASELFPTEYRRWYLGEVCLVSLTFTERVKMQHNMCRSCCLYGDSGECGEIGPCLCRLADAMASKRWHVFFRTSELPKGCRV